ncbi:MAG: ACP S-malonyltransferase [bacterium]
MKKLAYIFPGQGVQKVGMGKELFESSVKLRDFFNKSNKILGFDLTNLMFYGPIEELSQTTNTQPAVFTVSMAYLMLLEEYGIHAEISAGHSLGEYSACAAAGIFSWEEGLDLVKKRAELMGNAYPSGYGKMAAVLGGDRNLIKEVCAGVKNIGIVEAVNYNAPGQVVISGETKAVEYACEELKKRGIKRVIFLNTSGPFHSSLMDKTAGEFLDYMENIKFSSPKIPIISNVTGKPMFEPNEIKKMLALQMKSPVLWDDSMRYILNAGITDFIEVGQGNVLQGLLKRIDPRAEVVCMDEKWKELMDETLNPKLEILNKSKTQNLKLETR